MFAILERFVTVTIFNISYQVGIGLNILARVTRKCAEYK